MQTYLNNLCASTGASYGWRGCEYVLNFGTGLKDPTGQPLEIEQLLQVLRGMMPSALTSAGKTIRLQGPMPGAAAALICRECYAARVIVEILDRATGITREVPIDRLDRDHVRLIQPDTSEQVRDVGNGWVLCRTSQLSYRRRSGTPIFRFQGVLELVFIETRSTRHATPRAQVSDGVHFAWVDNLNVLEDVA